MDSLEGLWWNVQRDVSIIIWEQIFNRLPRQLLTRHVLPFWSAWVPPPPVFSGVRVAPSLVFCLMFCRSLFVFFYFFFWPLCCLFFDIRILITILVSSNSSFRCSFILRRIWSYKRGNQNLYIEDGQTTQWSKEMDKWTNNDLQNFSRKTKHRATRNLTKKQEWTRVLRKVQKYLFHQWNPSCYTSYKLPIESFEYFEYISYHIKLSFLLNILLLVYWVYLTTTIVDWMYQLEYIEVCQYNLTLNITRGPSQQLN